jgi:hypothetical protein
MFAGGAIRHRSVKQRLVTISTIEADYVALRYAVKEATLLYRLLRQLSYGSDDTRPILIYGNNKPSIKLLRSEGHSKRSKHVDIYYHYIKIGVQDRRLEVEHVRATAMAAYGLTKLLERVAHFRFLSQIGLTKPTIITTKTSNTTEVQG